MNINTVTTTPFEGQKPGTSGLRKKVPVFRQQHYLENFVQATFNAIKEPLGEEGVLVGSVLVVGGDGRFYMKTAVQTIIKMACANSVSKVIVGTDGLLSTPAVSALIRRCNARGGFICTASHNPGGPTEDFGVKYNIANGGPAPDSVTARMHAETQSISEYQTCTLDDVDLSVAKEHTFFNGTFSVQVVDSADQYVALMKELFDFPKIKAYIATKGCKLKLDCMHGVAGPYATRIFVEELSAGGDAVINNVPLEDFGQGHPDPNLTYAKSLVDVMAKGEHDIGAAFDGDADRNMILGKSAFFVTPSDSVAVLANNAKSIPYLASEGITGVSRSMPTGAALDRVAKKLGVEFFEVPTGWKYFGNLMDAGRLTICGEESFGTGSNHIREKDVGVLSTLIGRTFILYCGATFYRLTVNDLLTLRPKDILKDHWQTYGRNFFTRYDYEQVESAGANDLMAKLRGYEAAPEGFVGRKFGGTHTVKSIDDFTYVDPTNNEKASRQGIRIIFTDGSRVIFRLSGTGSSGATVRMYVDSYIDDATKYMEKSADMLKPLVDIALEISELKAFTGRDEPTVIT